MSKSEALDRILKLVARVAYRIRIQHVFDGLITGGTIAIFWIAFGVVLQKTGWFAFDTLFLLMMSAAIFPIGLAVFLGTRKLNRIVLAQRLDESHSLHDRLSTAVSLGAKNEESEWAVTQIRDAAAHAEALDVKRAAPFRKPIDLLPFIVALITLGGVMIFQPPNHQHPLPTPAEIKHAPVLDSATLALEKEKVETLKKALKNVDDDASKEILEEIDELLKAVENKEISEKQFLDRIKKLQKKFEEKTKEKEKDATDELAEKLKQVAEKLEKTAAKELKDNKDAQDLVKALKEKKLGEASKALDKLAKKFLDPNMSEKELEKLAKLMEKFSDLIDPDDPAIKKLIEKHQKTLEKLMKKQNKGGKLNQKEKDKLDRAKKALDKLKKKSEEHQKKKSTRELKKIKKFSKQIGERGKKNKKARKIAKRSKKKNPGERKNFRNESGRNTKKMSEDMKKSSETQKRDEAREKVRRQLEELKEAMKRSSNAKDGKESKESRKRGKQMKDLLDRAKGKKKGSKSGKKSKKSSKDGEKTNDYGGAKGDHKLKDETKMTSKKKDVNVKGQEGKGASKSEIIKAASEKGFATKDYKKVFDDYESVVEEVMEKEKIPPGYRYYIKQYFKIIQPKDE